MARQKETRYYGVPERFLTTVAGSEVLLNIIDPKDDERVSLVRIAADKIDSVIAQLTRSKNLAYNRAKIDVFKNLADCEFRGPELRSACREAYEMLLNS